MFVEKPLATSVEDALAVGDAARGTGLPVVVGYVSRFDHRYALVHEAIRTGRLGRVERRSPRAAGFSRAWFEGFGTRVHPVFESMIHDIDLALWYLGAPVRSVFAHALASDPGRRRCPTCWPRCSSPRTGASSRCSRTGSSRTARRATCPRASSTRWS